MTSCSARITFGCAVKSCPHFFFSSEYCGSVSANKTAGTWIWTLISSILRMRGAVLPSLVYLHVAKCRLFLHRCNRHPCCAFITPTTWKGHVVFSASSKLRSSGLMQSELRLAAHSWVIVCGLDPALFSSQESWKWFVYLNFIARRRDGLIRRVTNVSWFIDGRYFRTSGSGGYWNVISSYLLFNSNLAFLPSLPDVWPLIRTYEWFSSYVHMTVLSYVLALWRCYKKLFHYFLFHMFL